MIGNVRQSNILKIEEEEDSKLKKNTKHVKKWKYSAGKQQQQY